MTDYTGMYARTPDGIMKIVECLNDRFVNEYGDVYFYNDMMCNPEKNILALIQEGDLVNKKEVKKIIHFDGDDFYRIELFGGKAIMSDKNINSIITKEQIEDNAYFQMVAYSLINGEECNDGTTK